MTKRAVYHQINSMKKILIGSCLALIASGSFAQNSRINIPAVLSHVTYDADGNLVADENKQHFAASTLADAHTLSQLLGNPAGAETGITLDFNKPGFNGTIAYGTVAEEAEYPTTVFQFKAVIENGRALLNLKKDLKKTDDYFKLNQKGKGLLGYRVMNSAGNILYEGRVAFNGIGPYTVVPTIVEGPFVSNLSPTGCVVSFETQVPVKAAVESGGRSFADAAEGTHHEILISGLQPLKEYTYNVTYGDRRDHHHFKTAPETGSRKPFSFAFVSGNRANVGGGDRDIWGTNAQTTKAIAAAAVLNNAAFMQITGDISSGNTATVDGHLLQFANFKRAAEPFWHSIPVYMGMGNHESVYQSFGKDSLTKEEIRYDKFPYVTESSEATFARAVVNPANGPGSEDGAAYDPDPKKADFPTYKENVYYYTYDNAAVVVLNSDYWLGAYLNTSGSPQGYIMDNQYKWLQQTVQKLEGDAKIDHIFVAVHVSLFPSGDHIPDAMWYLGNNDIRAKVAGVSVKTGVIERRDQILDLLVNKSKKFLAILTGDEHNFAMLEVTPDFPMYPADYALPKLKLSRSFYHINNGAGGAGAYGMGTTPWMAKFKYFTEPPAISLITVDGKNVSIKAFNPETFGKITPGTDVKLR
jgi:hypothetical protein